MMLDVCLCMLEVMYIYVCMKVEMFECDVMGPLYYPKIFISSNGLDM